MSNNPFDNNQFPNGERPAQIDLTGNQVRPKTIDKKRAATAAILAGVGGAAAGAGGLYVSQILTDNDEVVDAEVVGAASINALHKSDTGSETSGDQDDSLKSMFFSQASDDEQQNDEIISDPELIKVGDENGYVNAVLVDTNEDGVFDSTLTVDPIYGNETPPPAPQPVADSPGLPDAYADQDYDGKVDSIIVDENQDGIYDTEIELVNDAASTTESGSIYTPEAYEVLDIAGNVNDNMSFAEAFAAARNEVGAGGIFYWHGKPYGTYYESEWNSMSEDDKADYWDAVYKTTTGSEDSDNATVTPEPIGDNEVLDIADNVTDDMSFADAFAAARSEVGAGGIFYWHGKAYGTYYENEWAAMSDEDKADYWDAVARTTSDDDAGSYTTHVPEPGYTLDVAHGVTEDMNFSEAFASAREEVGAGGIFYWHGKPYGTYYENEWNAMDEEDKTAYWDAVGRTTASDDDGYYGEFEDQYDPYLSDYDGDGLSDADDATPYGDDDSGIGG